MIRRVYCIRGIVQGVGFRPTLLRLARAAELGGSVQNRAGCVQLILDGDSDALDAFIHHLPDRLPPLARIDSLCLQSEIPLPTPAPAPFQILFSDAPDEIGAVLPPDAATCPSCRAELFDPANRRHGYPFITCADCGPRYTLIHTPPYDRERTAMARFPLCPDCRAEYRNPLDRRFHAESIACPVCGPRLTLADAQGRPLADPPLPAARAALAAGRIVALQGIGGFHLAADARQADTVARLRQRKHRPAKPFAVMADTLISLRAVCAVPPAAHSLLQSFQAPIVILDLLPDADRHLAVGHIAPDTATLGVFLPTSPLHHLLFTPLPGDPTPPFPFLIMTSGNRGGEPVCLTEAEAFDRLRGIADLFLIHDRPIIRRNDDSIAVIRRQRPQVWRRARGYAPIPFPLLQPGSDCVLALGAELKNTVALRFDRHVVLSPHIGDLETPEAVEALEHAARDLPAFYRRSPRRLAVDAHPDYHSTRLGRRLGQEWSIPLTTVQHHHAHALACLHEHGRREGLALVLDGTGWGTDGSLWGAELMSVTPAGFRRLATFAPAPLPGGDAAVRHPLRQLIARRFMAGLDPAADQALAPAGQSDAVAIWHAQCRSGIACPHSHSAGRMFDAVAALLGVAPETVTYEGQAAVRLEAAARRHGATPPPAPPLFDTRVTDGIFLLDWTPLFQNWNDLPNIRRNPEERAAQFHVAMAQACRTMIEFGRSAPDVARDAVALSGGVFMNQWLCEYLAEILAKHSIEPLFHQHTPPNDGCIALGQALVEV